MRQLFILLALSIVLGSTVGVPAPEFKEVEVMDVNSEPESSDNFLPVVEKRAVSSCK